MYHVQSIDKDGRHRAVRHFDSLYEAVGYLTAYVLCGGGVALVYGKDNEQSYVAKRERFGLVLTYSFGKTVEAMDFARALGA